MSQTDHFAKPIAFTWAIAYARWPIFKNVFISLIFCVFSSGLLRRTTLMWLNNHFPHILAFLICEPNWPFCKAYTHYMGYSLGKMPDFKKRLISLIFGVFSSAFLRRTTLMWLNNRFSHVFNIFNFWARLTILQSLKTLHGLSSFQDGRFSKTSHFSNIWCFFKRLFAQNNSNVIKQSFFASF